MLPIHVRVMVTLSGGCWSLVAAWGCPAVAAADDFRVENRIFAGDAKTPQSQGTTIFHEGLVIDFCGNPAEVVIFDPRRRGIASCCWIPAGGW